MEPYITENGTRVELKDVNGEQKYCVFFRENLIMRSPTLDGAINVAHRMDELWEQKNEEEKAEIEKIFESEYSIKK